MAHASLGMGWQVAGGVVAAAVSAYSMFPVLLPQYTRRFYQRVDSDTFLPVDVDETTLSLLDNVLTKLKMPESKEKSLDVYVTRGTSAEYHGSFGQRTSCLMGLPHHFSWTGEQDFERESADSIKRNFPWEHAAAEAVKRSLLLTDAEKEFVIARQLGYLDTQHVWMKYGQRMVCVLGGFLAAHYTNVRLGWLQGEIGRGRAVSGGRATRLAGSLYTLYMLVGFGISTLLNDSYSCHLDNYADKYAGTISPEFSLAGYNYYNKILNANKALREILPDGERHFTIFGNEVQGIIRVKTTPLVSRRDYLKRLHDKQVEGGSSTQPQHPSQQTALDKLSMSAR